MNVKENVQSGIITSITGAVIVIGAIASVFVKDLGITWTEASVALTIGVGLIIGGKK